MFKFLGKGCAIETRTFVGSTGAAVRLLLSASLARGKVQEEVRDKESSQPCAGESFVIGRRSSLTFGRADFWSLEDKMGARSRRFAVSRASVEGEAQASPR